MVRSPNQIAWAKLKQHTLAVYGGIVLIVLYVAAAFADLIAPYDFATQFRTKPWHPPSEVHWRHADGKFALPFIYNTVKVRDEAYQAHYVEVSPQNIEYLKLRFGPEFKEAPREYRLRLFPRGDPHKFLGLMTMERRLFGVESTDALNRPAFFLLGSEQLGRDLFSRLLYGARVSLSVGLIGVTITFTLGMLVGGISGYFRGKVDVVLQRLIEMIMLLPGFYIMLALRAALPPDLGTVQTYFAIIFILAFVGWAGLARTTRGLVMSISQNDYVTASRALGVGSLSLIVRHILPQTFSYAIVVASMAIPGYMLGESGLSYLGLGIQEPYSSWGNMLQAAGTGNDIKSHPWVLVPGFMIFITVVAFQFLGDGLRDAFDPKTVLQAKKGAA
ncbi:MAG: ABC transporter permease [Planctomycetes bacterium]|nr:ABC transporter permease [Planctomycetota bacterium]